MSVSHQTPEEATANNADMSVERARVVSVQRGAIGGRDLLWVEAFQRSTCGSCTAREVCGQGVLSRWFARKARHYSVVCEAGEASLLTVGQWVEIAVPNGIVVRVSLLVYILPLLFLITGAGLSGYLFGTEPASIAGGLAGVLVGFYSVRQVSQWLFSQHADQPRLLRAVTI